MTRKDLLKYYSGKSCRSCINIDGGMHLVRKDCIYEPYPGKCSYCGEMKNIVSDVRFSGVWKMFWHIR